MATKKTAAAQSAARNAAKLPADLPTNWTDGQTVSPGGEEVGLTKQHGYNYLMEQVNAVQQAANELFDAAESSDAVKYTPQTLTDGQKGNARLNIEAMPQYPIATVSDCNTVSIPGQYRLTALTTNTPISNPETGDLLLVVQWDQKTAYQLYFHLANPTELYVRGSSKFADIANWTPWQKLASAAFVEDQGGIPFLGGYDAGNDEALTAAVNDASQKMAERKITFAVIGVDVMSNTSTLTSGKWKLLLCKSGTGLNSAGQIFALPSGFNRTDAAPYCGGFLIRKQEMETALANYLDKSKGGFVNGDIELVGQYSSFKGAYAYRGQENDTGDSAWLRLLPQKAVLGGSVGGVLKSPPLELGDATADNQAATLGQMNAALARKADASHIHKTYVLASDYTKALNNIENRLKTIENKLSIGSGGGTTPLPTTPGETM